MGIQVRQNTAVGGPRGVCQKFIVGGLNGGQAGGQINLWYYGEPKDQSTKIVFIQVMRELLDGTPVLPSALASSFGYQDADTTARFYHVDYVPGMVNPWPADLGDPGHVSGSAFGPLPYVPGTPAKFYDDPEFHAIPPGGSWMRWEFRTAAFSAAGADAGTYYAYQDWSYEVHNTGAWKSLLGPKGFDPGQDFKDAVSLWAGNHPPFKVPTPPPPLPPPAYKGAIPYRTQSGDNLQTIAIKFYGNGVYWTVLFAANGYVFDPSATIPSGQVLVIP